MKIPQRFHCQSALVLSVFVISWSHAVAQDPAVQANPEGAAPDIVANPEAPIPPEPPADAANPSAPGSVFLPPVAPNPEIYQKLADPSPFTSRPSTDTGMTASTFPEMTLIGIMTIDGKINAWVQPADAEEPVQLVEGAEPTANSNMRLIRVISPDNMYQAVAEIEAGGQTGQVRFTDASVAVTPGAGGPVAAAKQGGQPGQPGQPNGIQQPQGQPNSPNPMQMQRDRQKPKSGSPSTVTPRRRVVIPR